MLTPELDTEKRPKMINPPVYRGSTVLFENYEELLLANKNMYEGPVYGTDRLPNQRLFEEALNELEGGYLTRAFQSGLAAIQNTLMAFTKSGDHVLICDNAYGPGSYFCRKLLAKFNVKTTVVPPSVGSDIEEYIEPETVLILLESPGSITFELQDIPAVTAIAKKNNIITVLDNTWATPLYLHPFELGVDVSIQAVTKYISGYSDVLMGAVTVNEKYAETFRKFYAAMGFYASPEDCYLALRGLTTLPVRLKQHEQSALTIAQWLEAHDLVKTVIHPALSSHPEHHIWKRDFKGSAGLFAFIFRKDYSPEHLGGFVNALNLFGIGYSWGGYKSLITAGKNKRVYGSRYSDKTIIRLSIGLEDPDELIEDLAAGFNRL